MRLSSKERKSWVMWLRIFGAAKLFDSIMVNAQGAESRCIHCGKPIYFDIVEGGGVPDWKTADGDYGCTSVRANGSHMPKRLTL